MVKGHVGMSRLWRSVEGVTDGRGGVGGVGGGVGSGGGEGEGDRDTSPSWGGLLIVH
jgi:hypothetical protein